jgi:nucleoside-diphosphate-sugar epimerase
MFMPESGLQDRMPQLFCFGLGYSAEALARVLLAQGWSVAGSTRDAARRARLATLGIAVADAPPAGTTHLLSSVPPDAEGDPVLRAHGDAIARLRPAWIGYLSTTGVYGDHAGDWVDEATPPTPGEPRSRRRLAAEREWQALAPPAHIFRLAGIYGPGRSAIDQLRAGTAKRVVKPGHLFSRIHVDDIAGVLAASIARPDPGAIYNLCDDAPAQSDVVVAYAAELLGIAPPPAVPYEQAELTPMARSFYAERRRVRNERIKRELGVSLRYPTYREGLRAIRDAAE